MTTTYTIGEAAERSGFPASTLRYYEDHGLLEPAERSPAGYRLYDDASLARLRFIDRAKLLGCTLSEIAELAELWEDDDCAPVQARLHDLVTDKIADAQTRSAELVRFTAQLQTAAAHLGGAAVDGACTDDCACVASGPPSSPAAEPVPVVLGQRDDPAIACTLPSEEMSGRMDDWQKILGFVTGREATEDGGLRLALDPSVPLDEVSRLAAAEQGCCSFFAFAITVDQRGLALEVRAPDEAAELVTAVFGTASVVAG